MAIQNVCALYGSTTYTNGWLGINFLIILTTLLVIAFAWAISGFFPGESRSKIRGVTRFELIQAVISIAIIGVLLGLSLTACSISASISTKLANTQMNPFQYADYYVGSVSLNKGLTLLSNIYATSISYSVTASVLQNGAYFVYSLAASSGIGASKLFQFALGSPNILKTSVLKINFARSIPDISALVGSLSTVYLAIFSPFILIAVGLLFIQWLMIPLMQYTAFTVILPVALAMRAFAFTSNNLGDAANSLLAIAIVMYLVYPMTVAFDSYAVAWIFSSSNPAATYMNTALTYNTVTPFSYFTAAPATSNSLILTSFQSTTYLLKSFGFSSGVAAPVTIPFSILTAAWPPTVLSTFRTYINQMAQFIFVAVVLFVLNVSITIGLAISIYKALKSGLGESARFW